jgi:hypothetical protein
MASTPPPESVGVKEVGKASLLKAVAVLSCNWSMNTCKGKPPTSGPVKSPELPNNPALA